MNKYQKLFEEIQIHGKKIRNRFEAAPVSMGPVTKGEPLIEQVASELECYSSGGYGIYTIGEVPVCDEGNRREPPDHYDLTNLSEENLYPYKMAADIVKKNGCLALIELFHCGGRKKGISYGPSDIEHDDGSHTIEADEDKISEICESFADAALFMKTAGFDGVMCHFGHGWLVEQFLSPLTNFRTDRFGGSVKNRCRLAIMILERIREKTGEDFIIEVRMSGDELVPGGYNCGEFIEMAQILDEYADIIHVSMGLYGNPVATREFSGAYHEKGCNAYISEQLMKAVKHAKVSVVGGINDPDVALDIIEHKKADFVALGRQKFADPGFIRKIQAGHPELVYPCLRCFCCFSGPLDETAAAQWKPGCSVNPLHMRYEYMNMPLPDETKKVLVIGGGIAGLSFACEASKRGHKVTLVEKREHFGGILNSVKEDIHKEAFIRYIRALEANAEYAGAKLYSGRIPDDEILERTDPDLVVIATGAEPKNIQISLADGAAVPMQAIGAMDRLKEIGTEVLILGGGLVGCELAVFLMEHGRSVTIAARSRMLKNVYPLHGAAISMEMAKGVKQLEELTPILIKPGGVVFEDRQGIRSFIEADTVIEAFGLETDQLSTEAIKQQIRKICPSARISVIGDCCSPRRIKDAVSEGFLEAMHLGTQYRPEPQKSHWA